MWPTKPADRNQPRFPGRYTRACFHSWQEWTNPALKEGKHTMALIHPRLGRIQQFLKQIVFGANDGIVTTFAIVAGFAGAQAEGTAQIGAVAVLVFGLANLFADAVSMGLGEFLSLRAATDLARQHHARFMASIEKDRSGARDMLAERLVKRGLSPDDARDASAIFSKRPELMADMLLSGDHGEHTQRVSHPVATGLTTFAAFVTFGVIPLVPYFLPEQTDTTFAWSTAATLGALVALGILRWIATGERPHRAIGETVLVGTLCAIVAYVVGVLVA